MKTKKQEYIRGLINDEVYNMLSEAFVKGAPGSAGVSDFDDDGIDLDQILGFVDDSDAGKPDFSDAKKGKMGRDAYQGAVSGAKAAIDKMRSGAKYVPADDENGSLYKLYVDPYVKNKSNKYRRDNKNPNILGKIQVSFSYSQPTKNYNFPYCLISLFNVNPWDVKELAKKFSGNGHTVKVNTAATRQNFGKDGATFIVADKMLDAWKEEDLPQIISFLGSCKEDDGSPRYGGEEAMENLDATIRNRVHTQNDVEQYWYNSEKNNLEKYKAYLEAENDEDVNQIIELYSRGGLMDYVCKKLNLPESFGHILSWKNARAIIGSGRNATFVLPAEAWMKAFGRVVNPNAKPFFVRIPNAKNKRGKWKNPTAFDYTYIDDNGIRQSVRLSSTEDILRTFYSRPNGKYTPYDELTIQQQYFVNCLANINNVKDYYALQEFDVSDTVLDPNLCPKDSNGNPIDIFNETAGLSTNLRRGGINQAAKDQLAKHQAELDNDQEPEIEADDDAQENMDARLNMIINRTREAYKGIKAYADSKRISFRETPDDVSLSTINALLEIAKKEFPATQGVTNPRLYNKLAEDAVYFVCKIEYIALDQIKSFRHTLKVTENDVAQFSNIVDLLVNVVEGVGLGSGKIALEESEFGGWSSKPEKLHKKIMKFLSKINAEAEKENLFEMLRRMDASKKNLL